MIGVHKNRAFGRSHLVLFCALAWFGAGLLRPAMANERFERASIPTPHVVLQAVLFRPEGPGPFPAVIALHGCGGLWNKEGAPSARHADWAERLVAQGFMVLMPDSFGSRAIGSQCGVTDRHVRAGRERVRDVQAARGWLQQRPDVKPEAISVMGWANGGSTVLGAMRFDRRTEDGRPDFARAVAFYPKCRRFLENPEYRLRAPTLILIGDADDWTPPGPCLAFAAAAKGRGEPLDIIVYPGALHDFDHPKLETRKREGLAFTPDDQGVAHVGTNPEAREDALRRVPAFLAR